MTDEPRATITLTLHGVAQTNWVAAILDLEKARKKYETNSTIEVEVHHP